MLITRIYIYIESSSHYYFILLASFLHYTIRGNKDATIRTNHDCQLP